MTTAVVILCTGREIAGFDYTYEDITGGLFIDSSSEINPPVKPENCKAMVDAVGELLNPDLNPESKRTHR